MKLRIEKNLNEFKSIIEFVSKVNLEARFTHNEEGILIAANSSNNAVVNVSIPKTFFEGYEGPANYCLNLQDLNHAIKKTSGMFEMIIKDGMVDLVTNVGTIEVPIYDLDFETTIPPIEIPFKVTIHFANIGKAVDLLLSIDPEEITIEGDGTNLIMRSSEGRRTSTAPIVPFIEKFKAVFGVDYIKPLLTQQVGDVILSVGDQMPMLATFNKGSASIRYMFAPRIN